MALEDMELNLGEKMAMRAVATFKRFSKGTRWTKGITNLLNEAPLRAYDAAGAVEGSKLYRMGRFGARHGTSVSKRAAVIGAQGAMFGASSLRTIGGSALRFAGDHPIATTAAVGLGSFAAARPARGGFGKIVGQGMLGGGLIAQHVAPDDTTMSRHNQAMSSSYEYLNQEGGYAPGQMNQGPSGDIVFGLYNMRA